ncbi:hypothetical protein AMS68_006134 [Peltaster fructicola]|uniref:Mitochondrial import inner membrane translocase subunit n=1 Tax=Peltaster fructicola TaxID=286661 RepID=A0A6H0Y0T6_9PEZI|nr:hypothetical protein AMS68_006134 [Peltaster fructicola]
MDAKQTVIDQVRQQAAIANARALMEKISEHCYERCIPKPGSSLSSAESTCLDSCVQKYLTSWNTVSSQYLNHVQKRAGSAGGLF